MARTAASSGSRPRPRSTHTASITLRIPPELRMRLDQGARGSRRRLSEYIRLILEQQAGTIL